MSEIALDVRNLTKRFPASTGLLSRRSSVHAVDDVSFALRQGAITALVGESGSGKSTVARLLARLYDPTSGTILFGDHDVARDRSRRSILQYRSQVQMIFQDPFGSLNPAKTILHHIERPLRIHGIVASDQIEERAYDLLRTVGLVPPEHVASEVPARALGRAAPARRDRANARGRAGRPARRRAHEHARRLDPDRDPQLDAEAQGGAPDRVPLRHARSCVRALRRGRHPRDVRGADRRAGADRAGARRSRCIRTRSSCSPPCRIREPASRRSASRFARGTLPPRSTRRPAAASSAVARSRSMCAPASRRRSSRLGRATRRAATSTPRTRSLSSKGLHDSGRPPAVHAS